MSTLASAATVSVGRSGLDVVGQCLASQQYVDGEIVTTLPPPRTVAFGGGLSHAVSSAAVARVPAATAARRRRGMELLTASRMALRNATGARVRPARRRGPAHGASSQHDDGS